MKSKLKLGFIGGGFVGQVAHISNYVHVADCELAGLAEVKPKLRKKLMKHYGIKKVYDMHNTLLSDDELNAVVVVVRRPNIGPIALDVLKAGKHLLVEKPMCHTFEQGKLLVDTAKERGVKFAVGYMRRHDEGVQFAKDLLNSLILSNEVGKVVFARVHCFAGLDGYHGVQAPVTTDEDVPANLPEWELVPNWLPSEKISGYASFLNVYCHNINLMRYLFNKDPKVNYARLENPNGNVVVFDYDEFCVVLEAGSSSCRGWDDHVEIYFEKGKLTLALPSPFLRNVPADVKLFKESKSGIHEVIKYQLNKTWAFMRQAEAFVEDIIRNRPLLASGEDALMDLKIVEDIWKFNTIKFHV